MADHKWTGKQMGGPPDMAESTEWFEFCEVCGMENGGSGVIMPPCPDEEGDDGLGEGRRGRLTDG